MMMMIDPDYHKVLFYIVLATSPTSTVGAWWWLISHGVLRHVVVSINSVVMMASIAYWWHPVRGWRRTVDMAMVGADMVLHYVLYWRTGGLEWLAGVAMCQWTVYHVSWLFHYYSYSLGAVSAWILLHFITHISNIITYRSIP